jgi:hypothetical protein
MKGGKDDGLFCGDVGTDDKHTIDPLDGVLGQVLISLVGVFARPQKVVLRVRSLPKRLILAMIFVVVDFPHQVLYVIRL